MYIRKAALFAQIVVQVVADNHSQPCCFSQGTAWLFSFYMILRDSFIYLRKLRFHALIGVVAQERLTGNDYEVDLRLKVDVARAMKTDDVNATVNYAEAYNEVAWVMAVPCNLVEHAAYKIGKQLMNRWPEIEAIDVFLTKINPPMGADCDGAGVELHLINDKTQI